MNFENEEYLEEDRELEDLLIKTKPTYERTSFLIIPTYMLRNHLYRKWNCTNRAGTAWYLYSYVIRKQMNNAIADHLHKKYYNEKKLLVARFTQQRLAEEMGYKDRRGVNNHMVQLYEEGIFKVHMEPWRNRVIRVYEFGTWETYKGQKIETLHLITKFNKEFADLEFKKFLE